MDLAQLILCYDGSKKLGMAPAAAKLEKLIYKVASKMLKDYVTANKGTENDKEEDAA